MPDRLLPLAPDAVRAWLADAFWTPEAFWGVLVFDRADRVLAHVLSPRLAWADEPDAAAPHLAALWARLDAGDPAVVPVPRADPAAFAEAVRTFAAAQLPATATSVRDAFATRFDPDAWRPSSRTEWLDDLGLAPAFAEHLDTAARPAVDAFVRAHGLDAGPVYVFG